MPVYNFSTFDDPSATSFVGTQAFGINGSGQIVGAYANGSGNHGFLLSGGVYASVDDPLATFGGTQAFGINGSGQIVGAYANGSGNHGFLLSGGVYASVDDPLATFGGTQAFGINGSGQIVGAYANGSGNHGFLYNPNGGTYTTLDDPLATNGTFAITNGTFATGINASGQIVGYYATNTGFTGNHGFLYPPSTIRWQDPPARCHSA